MLPLAIHRWWWRNRWRILSRWWSVMNAVGRLYCRTGVLLRLRDPKACRVCGRSDLDGWDPAGQLTYCEDHCPDHDFQHEQMRSGWWCSICGKPAPADWYAY